MDINTVHIKMKALKNQIERWLNDNPHKHMPLVEAEGFFNEYKILLKKLEESQNGLFNNLPLSAKLETEETGSLILSRQIKNLLNDLKYCLDILEAKSEFNDSLVKITKEGIFFAGQYYDAFKKINEILQSAEKTIYVIDGYIDVNFLDYFDIQGKNIKVEIITKAKSNKPNLQASLRTFNKQYGTLCIRTSEAFHDRFIIIDENEFYHFGASIKDAGNKGFMFSIIEETFVTKALLNEYKKEWTNSIDII
ncbi:MAG: hypothetical protein ACR2J3_09990 [Aridibacter sp.]